MSRRKTERLLNLVIALLATRYGLSAEAVRSRVPGYAEEDIAFRRTFERDKEELRELGVPVETVTDWEGEPVYRITRRDYELPAVHLSADEAAAVGLAARVWQEASLGAAATWARRKLAAAGAPVEQAELALPRGLEPRLDATEPAFPALRSALRERREVTFAYHSAIAAEPERRRVAPWGLLWRLGRWYLVGHDGDRRAVRVFRLSRIVGEVHPVGPPGAVTPPVGVDIKALVAAREEPRTLARIRVRPGRAADLRRDATTSSAGAGWDEIVVGFDDPGRFAARLAGYGADVVALDPPELRERIVEHLRALR